MKKFLTIICSLALCLLVYSSACYSASYPSGAWRYRMTVTVETPEGIRTGSAVREVSVQSQPCFDACIDVTKVRGEAVVVDLGKRGILFALLRSQASVDYASNIFFTMFPITDEKQKDSKNPRAFFDYYDQLKNATADIPLDQPPPDGTTKHRDYLPEFVWFRDMNDPKSVELVKPDNMAASFGEGVKLKDVKIEITSEPVTTGIEKRIPPYGQETGWYQWQRALPYGSPLAVGPSEFEKRSMK